MENSIKLGREQQASETFEFDGKSMDTKLISIEDLGKSIRRESGLAGIRNIPIQFWKMYSNIIDMLKATEINYNTTSPVVQNNSSKAYLTDTDKGNGYIQKYAPIEKWRFDKVIQLISLPNMFKGSNEDNARNAVIGLTLNKEGLSVAFGMNVWACSNFNVLGGTVLHSYGKGNRDSMPWDVMSNRLEQWVGSMDQIWSVQNEIMAAMQEFILQDDSIVQEVIGDLYQGAIKQAYFKGAEVPFNTNELSNFVQESIKQQKDGDSLANVWDLYNWGTEIMKPGRFDIGQIADNSNMWADYIIDKFKLDAPKQIIEIH